MQAHECPSEVVLALLSIWESKRHDEFYIRASEVADQMLDHSGSKYIGRCLSAMSDGEVDFRGAVVESWANSGGRNYRIVIEDAREFASSLDATWV